MPEEIQCLVDHLTDVKTYHIGKRDYHQGLLYGLPSVVVFSRWGKVAAATTTTTLIEHFEVQEVIFTGVAGGIDERLHIGDVVIGRHLYQHDMDARPLMPRFEIPLLSRQYFEADPNLQAQAQAAAQSFVQQVAQNIPEEERQTFHLQHPQVRVGDIASGDAFVATRQDRARLREALPELACVEMEGGAMAQVCYEFGVPFVVIRTISDTADEHAAVNFPRFVKKVAQRYTEGIIRNLYQLKRPT